NASNRGRRVRRQVEERAVAFHSMQHTVGANRDIGEFRRARQRREYDVGGSRDIPRGRLRRRAGRDVRRDRLETNVVHVHLVARGAQARRHASAHRAEPDESDLHSTLDSLILSMRNGISQHAAYPIDANPPGGSSMRLISFRSLVMVAALLVLPFSAFAQEAVISGTIADATGGVLPGVVVRAVNQASGNNFESVTDATGTYRMPVRVGIYEITAELAGFTTVTRRGLELLVGQQAVINMQMSPSTIQESVTVTGEAPLIETTVSSMS